MPRKLGQHFLHNTQKIKQIIDSLNLEGLDTVLEIGPGKGALTKELGDRDKELNIIAVERDEKLIDYLTKKVIPDIESKGNTVEIIFGNILTVLPEISTQKKEFSEYKIVGNIPYYITGKLFRVFEEIEQKPEVIVLTVQREVADRLEAEPPNMNLLSASVKYWAAVEKLMNIPKKDFSPAPDVDSAVVRLYPKKHDSSLKESYYETINIVFAHPRKTVLNNLSIGLENKTKKELGILLSDMGIDPSDRPQNLSVESLISLSKII